MDMFEPVCAAGGIIIVPAGQDIEYNNETRGRDIADPYGMCCVCLQLHVRLNGLASLMMLRHTRLYCAVQDMSSACCFFAFF